MKNSIRTIPLVKPLLLTILQISAILRLDRTKVYDLNAKGGCMCWAFEGVLPLPASKKADEEEIICLTK